MSESTLKPNSRRNRYKGKAFSSKSEDQSKASKAIKEQIEELSSDLLGFNSNDIIEVEGEIENISFKNADKRSKRQFLKRTKVKSEY